MKFGKLFNKLLTLNTKVKVYLETDYVGNSSVANYIGHMLSVKKVKRHRKEKFVKVLSSISVRQVMMNWTLL